MSSSTSPNRPDSGTLPHCPRCGAVLSSGRQSGPCPRCLMGQALEDAGDRVGSAASDPTEEEIADLFPALKDIRCVGRGGMGVVFKARQPALDRMIALKVLRRESANDPAFTERFRREARALARLNHPNIVAVHEFGEIGGLFHVVMEYVEGASLRELLRGGRLEPELALSIVPRLCDALQYAHDEGVVHRDIKPENILIDIRGRVKIADFGLARLLGPSAPDAVLTHTQDVMGTPHYMAPEQLEGGREIDHRADIYALGVVLYEMLTGSLPRGRFDPPSRTPAVDARLDEIVLRSLEHEPGRRYQTAREVKGDIEGVADRSATMPQPLSATESSRNIGCGTAGDPRAPRWWIRTGTVAQRMLRSLLWLGLAAAGLMLVSSRGSGGPESMRVEIGAPRPWLTVDRWSEGHAFAFHMVGFAVLMMAVVLAAGGLRRLPLVHRQICWRCGAGSDADADHCPDCGSETATAARETTGRHRLGAAIAWIPIAAFLAVAWSARPPGIAAKPGAVPEWEEGSPADSPILRAAGAGRIGEIRALLRAGADVNDKGPDGATALIVAARNGHVSAVLTLILLGAAVDDADAEGRTALMAAAEGGHAAVAKAMSDLATTLAVIRDEVRKSRSEDEDPGSLGIRMMRERIGGVDVALFDEIGLRVPDIEIDLAAQDLNGETALMKAAARGDAAFAMAVPAWEEENARDAAGRTAVMHAALHGRTEFVRALIGRHHRSHGTTAGSFGSHTLFHPAALAATDGEERTAIRIAEDEGHAELAALLRAEMRRAEEHYSRAIEAGGPWTYQWYRHRGWAREALGESAAAAADHAEADRREPLELRFDGALGPEENDAGEVEG